MSNAGEVHKNKIYSGIIIIVIDIIIIIIMCTEMGENN